MKKSYYLDLMEITLSAYSTAHIDRYYQEVKSGGLKEHGFPRLTANIGILMAHGRCLDLKDRFIAMMDLCCDQFLKVKAGNDFSVKEIVFCMQELEHTDVICADKMMGWKELLKQIDPYECYTVYARTPDDIVHNWAAFTMVSEYMRQTYGLTDVYSDFIDLQAFSQLRHLDENKQYRDPMEPMVYDLVTRGLFAVLLDQGYRGKYREIWESALEESAIPTLRMQSVTGEIAYGGRSNQFIHNEAHLVILLEYYAKYFAKKGDLSLAGKFKAAVERALENIAFWLKKRPLQHIKNRFPLESKYGCEDYAYFDKYMITAASFLYAAYRICDDSVPVGELDDYSGMTWQSSDAFHKVFLRAGEYFAEYDYKADYHYDCHGLGRLHRKGVPSELCCSTPCPEKPCYTLDIPEPFLLAIAPGIRVNGEWQYATAKEVVHTVKKHFAEGGAAEITMECIFPGGEAVSCDYFLDANGLQIEYSGAGSLGCLLPVFRFNGKTRSDVVQQGNELTVSFGDHRCTYTVFDGTIRNLNRPSRNRNGHYDAFAAEGAEHLKVRVVIEKI